MREPIVALATAIALVGPAAVSANADVAEKALLEAALQAHIDRAAVAGCYPVRDGAAGEVRLLRQKSPHPVVLQMGACFVLCSDFESPHGAPVSVDFFLAPKDGGFVVFGQQVDRRDFVTGLMQEGKAARLG